MNQISFIRYEIELEVKHQVCETDPSISVAGEEMWEKITH